MAVRLGGFVAKTCTAQTYWSGAPDDLEDAYVRKDGRLSEVWDVGIDLVDGKIALYGNWPDAFLVDPSEQIYYSHPDRWERHVDPENIYNLPGIAQSIAEDRK